MFRTSANEFHDNISYALLRQVSKVVVLGRVEQSLMVDVDESVSWNTMRMFRVVHNLFYAETFEVAGKCNQNTLLPFRIRRRNIFTMFQQYQVVVYDVLVWVGDFFEKLRQTVSLIIS